MNVSIFGLGYVGCVSLACLSQRGHRMIGVDVNPDKVALIGAGRSPIVEPGLEELIANGAQDGSIRATADCREAVHASDVSLICVGTPSDERGRLSTKYVERVAQQIGEAIATKDSSDHLVVLRSTVLPGTTASVLVPNLAKHSGGKRVRVAFNPEFLREGTAVADFWSPPKTVIGADNGAGEPLVELYAGLPGSVHTTSIEVAEMLKYVDNAFHALKVTFGNEIGRLCDSEGIDAREVMEIFVQDRKLNISEAYLRPGFAYGGSCLPKDLRALLSRARDHHLDLPVLSAIPRSNRNLIEEAIRGIQRLGRKKVGILGLTFKPDTDDVRESPMVEIAERLLGKGYDLAIHDRCVKLTRLTGSNKAYFVSHIPHIERLLHADLESVVNRSEVLVIGTKDAEYLRLPEMVSDGQEIVDLAKLITSPTTTEPWAIAS